MRLAWLAENTRASPRAVFSRLMAAFLEAEGFQCGYCTSRMIVASVALLTSNPNPSHDDVVSTLARNVCRCGTYPRILAAVQAAAKKGTVGCWSSSRRPWAPPS